APTYFPRTRPVTVDPNRPGGDGEAGEGDDVRPDIESILGGKSDDRLGVPEGLPRAVADGEPVRPRLLGGAGDDTLIGSSDADLLDGGTGSDTLVGRGGNDSLLADFGGIIGDRHEPDEPRTTADDTLDGGPGNDFLQGNAGKDLI